MRRRSAEATAGLTALWVFAAVPTGALVGRPSLLAVPLVRDDRPAQADAVFVASGDVDFHRTHFAVDVFRRTGAKWMLFSGAGIGGDSGELMAEEAIRLGVPREAVRFEGKAETTRENAVFAWELVRGVGAKRVAVVTDPLHSRRFAAACERAWPGVVVEAATVPEERDPLGCSLEGWTRSERCRTHVGESWKALLWYLARGWI